MKYKLVLFPAAKLDVKDAAAYIPKDSLANALRLYVAVDSTFQQIRSSPTIFPCYEMDHPRLKILQKRAVLHFPKYLVFYRVEGKSVEVLRVLHGARDIPAILREL